MILSSSNMSLNSSGIQFLFKVCKMQRFRTWDRSLTTIISRAYSIANSSPSTMQSILCTWCGQILSWQCGYTHNNGSTHVYLHPNPSNLSISARLDYNLADKNKQRQPPQMQILSTPEPQLITPYKFNLFRMITGTPLVWLLHLNNVNFIIVL